MVCRSTPGNSFLTSFVRLHVGGLGDEQIQNIFHSARQDAPRSAPAPTEAERQQFISGWESQIRTSNRISESRRANLLRRVGDAFYRDVDGRSFHAWQTLAARAEAARTALDAHYAHIARRHATTPERVQEAFQTMWTRNREGDQQIAPTPLPYNEGDVPSDRDTRYALSLLYAYGPTAANPAHEHTARLRAARIADTRSASAMQCPGCGQFCNDTHTCPAQAQFGATDLDLRAINDGVHAVPTGSELAYVTSDGTLCASREAALASEAATWARTQQGDHEQTHDDPEALTQDDPFASLQAQPTGEPAEPDAPAPARRPYRPRTNRRTYSSMADGRSISVLNLSALREHLRDGETRGIDITYIENAPDWAATVTSDRSNFYRVTGSAAVTDTRQRITRNRDRYTVEVSGDNTRSRTLRCNCPDYGRNYDCEHLRNATTHLQALLNRRDPAAVIPPQVQDAVQANLQGAYNTSIVAQQEAREAFRAASDGTPRWADDMAPFQSAWDESRTRVEAGDTRIPLDLSETGPRMTRTLGLEIEVDFPNDMTYEAKQRVAREIYEAGLSEDPYVHGWHYRGRETDTRGRAMGGGYTDNPNSWTVEHDSSVDGMGGQRGCEIVSPILYDTPETWRNVAKVCEIVERNGGAVTRRTGLHVNVGAADYDHTIENHNRLIGLSSAYEDVVVRMANNPDAGHRDHRGRDYCRPLNVPAEGYRTIRDAQRNLDGQHYGSSHRAMVNIDHMPAEGQPMRADTRVEVRIFDGTIDPGRIQANARLAGGLVDAAARGVAVPSVQERAGTHLSRNPRRRRLTGEDWERDMTTFRQFADAIYADETQKRQAVALLQQSRWQAQ